MPDPLSPISAEQSLELVAAELAMEFQEIPPETVDRVTREVFAQFTGSRIVNFIPILARRAARQRLRQHARPNETSTNFPQRVRPDLAQSTNL